MEGWPPDDTDLLAGWLDGEPRGMSRRSRLRRITDSVRLLALTLLTVLGQDDAPAVDGLSQPVLQALQVLCGR